MEKWKEQSLKFVLRYFKEDKLDTQRAIRIFKERHGIRTRHTFGVYRWVCGIAAMAFFVWLGVSRIGTLHRMEWERIVAEDTLRLYTLPDGTEVILFPHASLSYPSQVYGLSDRKVETAGRAFFSVRRDVSRPFEVRGERMRVRVLGTRFLMDESREDTSGVYVLSGKVEVFTSGQKKGVTLTEGMNGRFVSRFSAPEIMKTSRLTGSFEFHDASLHTVLTVLSTYYGVKLEADNCTKRLTAHFENEDLPTIIRFIEKTLQVKITLK